MSLNEGTEMKSLRTLGIAAIQTKPVVGDLEATLAQFGRQVRNVRSLFPNVQLVVVPELLFATGGPLLADDEIDPATLAERVPGPLTDRLAKIANETGMWLVPGSIFELGDVGQVYNTAVAISPDGDVVARYRKIFPWQPYEASTPGTVPVVFDIDGVGRIGLAICYDGSFPETVRQLAWLGAEVILQPTLTPTRDRDMELICARANAWTNQVYVVNVNAADPTAVGGSLIVDPEGMVRQSAGPGEEVLVDVLDLDAVTRVRKYGSQGLNRPWRQLAEHGANLHLPMYAGGVIQPPPWLDEATS